MKPVILTPTSWRKIREVMHTEYPASVFMIRSRMRSVLGFTPRDHREYVANPKYDEQMANARPLQTIVKGGYQETIHLDFFSENKRTMFLLKYGELLHDRIKNELE